MSVFKWRESFSTGVEIFDEDHRKIIDLVGRLYEALRDKDQEMDLEGIIKECGDYVETHLQKEEEGMQSLHYEKAEEHTREHDEFRREIARITEKLASSNTEGVAEELYHFLRHWFEKHIIESDRQYGPFFRDKDF